MPNFDRAAMAAAMQQRIAQQQALQQAQGAPQGGFGKGGQPMPQPQIQGAPPQQRRAFQLPPQMQAQMRPMGQQNMGKGGAPPPVQ